MLKTCKLQLNVCHTLSELTNILYLLTLVILTLFSLVDTITEGSWHLLIIYYWLTHYLFLLLLAQYSSLVACAHEHGAMDVGAGWRQDICHFQQGVLQKTVSTNTHSVETETRSVQEIGNTEMFHCNVCPLNQTVRGKTPVSCKKSHLNLAIVGWGSAIQINTS